MNEQNKDTETKKCNKCKVDKELEEFALDKSRKGGRAYKCKTCVSQWFNNSFYKNEDNKEKHLKRTKIRYYSNNYYQKRQLNNKDYYHQYYNKKWKENINYKIAKNFRNRLNLSLKSNKQSSSIDYLGCTIEEFKQHLESQFKPEMNWDNHGKIWEMDHIKPCESFNLEIKEEQFKCFHYSNMQPLFKTTKIAESFGYKNEIGNRNKSDKYE